VNWPRALLTCRRALANGATLDEVRDAVATAAGRTDQVHAR
jgi:hypothetical protein